MEASSGSAFLASYRIMNLRGTSILCLFMLIGETEGLVPVINLVVVMGGIPKVFLPTRIILLISFQFITGGSLRTPAVLRVALVTISLWRTTRTACKALPLVATPSAVVWLTVRMTPWMIAGISLSVNNLCGEFPLVVFVSVIFPFFLSLV